MAGIDVLRRPRAVRRVIGLAGQSASVEPAMTGRENLEMVARLFGLDRREAQSETDAVLGRLGLSEAGDRFSAPVEGGAEQLSDVVRRLDDRDLPVDNIGLRGPTLDEVFLALTGQSLDPDATTDTTDTADPATSAA